MWEQDWTEIGTDDDGDSVMTVAQADEFFARIRATMKTCMRWSDNFDIAYVEHCTWYSGPTSRWIDLKKELREWKESKVTGLLAESTKFPHGLVKIIAGYWDERVVHYRVKPVERAWATGKFLAKAVRETVCGEWIRIGLNNWMSHSEIMTASDKPSIVQFGLEDLVSKGFIEVEFM